MFAKPDALLSSGSAEMAATIERSIRMKLSRLNPKVRAAVAGAVCGVAASLLFGGAIAAFADGPQPGTPSAPISRLGPRGLGGVPVFTSSGNVHKVSAGPARPGVSAQLCNDHAAAINQVMGLKYEAMNDNDIKAAEAYQDVADGQINEALDDGCFVIL
jgi:hypothetical protein